MKNTILKAFFMVTFGAFILGNAVAQGNYCKDARVKGQYGLKNVAYAMDGDDNTYAELKKGTEGYVVFDLGYEKQLSSIAVDFWADDAGKYKVYTKGKSGEFTKVGNQEYSYHTFDLANTSVRFIRIEFDLKPGQEGRIQEIQAF